MNQEAFTKSEALFPFNALFVIFDVLYGRKIMEFQFDSKAGLCGNNLKRSWTLKERC